jgi:hypothetical protein
MVEEENKFRTLFGHPAELRPLERHDVNWRTTKMDLKVGEHGLNYRT